SHGGSGVPRWTASSSGAGRHRRRGRRLGPGGDRPGHGRRPGARRDRRRGGGGRRRGGDGRRRAPGGRRRGGPVAARAGPRGRRRRPALAAVAGAGDAWAREVTGPATADDREPDGTDAAGAEAGAAAGTVDAERLSDVDEWGRSQHMRDLLAVLYEPIYERW